MRITFVKKLVELAAQQPQIWLLCGDVGYSVLEPFADRFPRRFLNVGLAEQNMAGIAAGLAATGAKVFCYSIGNFPTLRCLEQIRNDICYHDLDVKIVAVGGGLAYGAQGYTHHAVEDIAVMRSLANMKVIAPADPAEVAWATDYLIEQHGPCYMRLAKAGEPIIHEKAITAAPGAILSLRDGDDVIVLSTGGMLETAIGVCDRLAGEGISAGVASVPFVKPLDGEFIRKAAARTGLICTIEEHGDQGGLADAVARQLVQMPEARALLVPFTLSVDILEPSGGTQDQLRRRAGLDQESITNKILAHFHGRREQMLSAI